MRDFKKIRILFLVVVLIGLITIIMVQHKASDEKLISLFPLEHYDQTVSTWINPKNPDFDKIILDPVIQQKHLDIFQEHYFGASSPWNADYVNLILTQLPPGDLKTIEKSMIDLYRNQDKPNNEIGYGENFRPHDSDWIQIIEDNMDVSQLDNITYHIENRGIAIDNHHVRALPTEDVYFYNHELAGEGYPFDMLQMSALWVGTPVYILAESVDHAWILVVSPDLIGWVKSSGIARANNDFINTWINAAEEKLAAITQTQISVFNQENQFLFSAYIGTVFPAKLNQANIELMAPVSDVNHNAVIKTAVVSSKDAELMPFTATPHHFALIMNELIGRPYGWGNMYFYNDCSAELKSLFTPFGIWLPRQSSAQVSAGQMVDMTAESPEKRLDYLMKTGQPLLTMVYIGGHIILYVGNYPDPHNPDVLMAMTYQNIWGLSPKPSTRRAVIGQSVLFPMLLQYPEDTSLKSLADKKYFQIAYLNQLPEAEPAEKRGKIDIKSLRYP